MKNDSALFFTCSLIEYIGRQQKLNRRDVVLALGKDALKRIYKYSDVLHCEPIAKVADEYIHMAQIQAGNYDNVSACRYDVPDYWTIGEVYERLIEDVTDSDLAVSFDIIETLMEVYNSWVSDSISNYNSDFYYQSRDYIYECYKAGQLL